MWAFDGHLNCYFCGINDSDDNKNINSDDNGDYHYDGNDDNEWLLVCGDEKCGL